MPCIRPCFPFSAIAVAYVSFERRLYRVIVSYALMRLVDKLLRLIVSAFHAGMSPNEDGIAAAYLFGRWRLRDVESVYRDSGDRKSA